MPLCVGDILQSPAKPCPASAGDDLRAKSRHFVPVALRNAACGRQCSHRPGKPCDAANPKRRAKSPALHCGREWVAMHKRQPSAKPAGGPMRSSAPAQRGLCCSRFRRPFALHCGRERVISHKRRPTTRPAGGPMKIISPCAGGDFAVPGFAARVPYYCRAGVHAHRGARQPGRVLAEQDAAPLSRLTPTAPLAGEPSRRQFPQSLPCKGRWMRRKAQTEGGIAALLHRYPVTPGRTLPRIRRGRSPR